MRSRKRGRSISAPDVEVLNVSAHGVWIWVKGREFFLPFEDYPWFREASIGQIQHVELHHGSHLHWPKLDVDLELDSLLYPEKYPLRYRG